MGLAAAKLVSEAGYYTILVGRTASKLEKAVADLRAAGGEVEAFSCDVSDRESCFALAKHAAERGEVKALLHVAGLSPHMGDAEKILRGNALGTVNINDAFYEVMAPGGCVIDTSSMSAYLAPQFIMPQGAYKLARTDREKFIKKLLARASIAPKEARPGLAYAISKHFVIWFAKTDAARFGTKNVRCLSALESEQADVFKKHSALKRNGRPEEIAALFTLLLDERLGFLTGADIIMDGGVVASGTTAELKNAIYFPHFLPLFGSKKFRLLNFGYEKSRLVFTIGGYAARL